MTDIDHEGLHQPPPEDPVTVFNNFDDLARLKKGDITTFPPGTRGLIRVTVPNPMIAPGTDPERMPGPALITIDLGVAATQQPLRGVNPHLDVRTTLDEDYDLYGFPIATIDPPGRSHVARMLGQERPTPSAHLLALFGSQDEVDHRINDALRREVTLRRTPRLPHLDITSVHDAAFMVGGPKFTGRNGPR